MARLGIEILTSKAERALEGLQGKMQATWRVGETLAQKSKSLGTTMSNAYSTARTKIGTSLSGIGDDIGALVRRATQFAAATAALAFFDFGRTIIEFEKFEGQLETVFGGAKDLANDAFLAIEDFASKTPFTLDQSVKAFTTLSNLGIKPTEANLTSFGNTASAMGKSLNQFIEAVADAATGEFERLKEFGIKAKQQGDDVAFTFKGITTTVGKNAEEITGYLRSIGENDFAGAMERQMDRLPGLLSNLRDNIQGLWRDIGNSGATDFFADMVRVAVEGTNSVREAIRSGLAGDLFSAITGQWASTLSSGFQILGGLGAGFVGWWGDNVVAPVMSFITGEEVQAGSGWQTYFSFIGESFVNLPANARAAFTIILGEADQAGITVVEAFRLMANSMDRLWLEVGNAGDVAWNALKLGAAIAIDNIILAFAGMVNSIGASLNALPDALVPDSWIAGIDSAAASLTGLATNQANVKAEIEATSASFGQQIAVLSEERSAIIENANVKRESSQAAIDAAIRERDAIVESTNASIEFASVGKEANEVTKDTSRSLDELAEILDIASSATESTSGSQEELKENLEGTTQAADQLRDSADQLGRDFEQEFTRLSTGFEDVRLESEKTAQGAVSDAGEIIDSHGNLQDEVYRTIDVYGEMAASFEGALGDQFKSVLDGGKFSFKEFTNTLLDSFKNMIAEMAAAWAASKIFEFFGGGGGGFSFGGGGSGFGGGGGGGNSLSTVSTAYRGVDTVSGGVVTEYFKDAAVGAYEQYFGTTAASSTTGASSLGANSLGSSSTSASFTGGGAAGPAGVAAQSGGATATTFNGSAGALEAFGGQGGAVNTGASSGGFGNAAAGAGIVTAMLALHAFSSNQSAKQNAHARDIFANQVTSDFTTAGGVNIRQGFDLSDKEDFAFAGGGRNLTNVIDAAGGTTFGNSGNVGGFVQYRGAIEEVNDTLNNYSQDVQEFQIMEQRGLAESLVGTMRKDEQESILSANRKTQAAEFVASQEIAAERSVLSSNLIATAYGGVNTTVEGVALAIEDGLITAAEAAENGLSSSAVGMISNLGVISNGAASTAANIISKFGSVDSTMAGVSAAIADGFITAAEASANGLSSMSVGAVTNINAIGAAAANASAAVASIPARGGDGGSPSFTPSPAPTGGAGISQRAHGGLVNNRGLVELAEEGPELVLDADITRKIMSHFNQAPTARSRTTTTNTSDSRQSNIDRMFNVAKDGQDMKQTNRLLERLIMMTEESARHQRRFN